MGGKAGSEGGVGIKAEITNNIEKRGEGGKQRKEG